MKQNSLGEYVGLLDFLQSHSQKTSSEEELLYDFVATEIEQGVISKGLWTKALSDVEFDERRARALYVKMRVASLKEELRELAPRLKEQVRLNRLLEQGCTQEAIDYLGDPIQASQYIVKYRVTVDRLNKAIGVGKIKAFLIDGVLWVQDRKY